VFARKMTAGQLFCLDAEDWSMLPLGRLIQRHIRQPANGSIKGRSAENTVQVMC
jgi:hypothetical protein